MVVKILLVRVSFHFFFCRNLHELGWSLSPHINLYISIKTQATIYSLKLNYVYMHMRAVVLHSGTASNIWMTCMNTCWESDTYTYNVVQCTFQMVESPQKINTTGNIDITNVILHYVEGENNICSYKINHTLNKYVLTNKISRRYKKDKIRVSHIQNASFNYFTVGDSRVER